MHPVKRRVRDVLVPALGRSPLIQRRAVSRLSHAAHTVSVLADPILRPYRGDLDVVSADATPVVLIRPDGHVAARGRPGSMEPVTGYLRDLFREPAGDPGRV